ncbi:MAG: hypothetical protein Q4B03_04710 [Lachnospiraceae bacterium]|nr:hypothetical protein [Lachnospiraceae bacterium]
MKFHSVNELEHFSFRDAQVFRFEERDSRILLEAEALIVRGSNSQNTRFYDSYADTAQINLVNGKVLSAVKEGFRYYDADGVLQKEVPDQLLTEGEIHDLLRQCSGCYLFSAERKPDTKEGRMQVSLGLEFGDDSEGTLTMGDSFWIEVSCSSVEVDWERYMNRVEGTV